MYPKALSKITTIYCISCAFCNKLYVLGETGGRFRFREHQLDGRNNGKDIGKPVAWHFNLPGHSVNHITSSGISLHCSTSDSRRRKEQSLIFKIGTFASMNGNHSPSFCKYQHSISDTYHFFNTFK